MTVEEKDEFRRLEAMRHAGVIFPDERDRYYELKRKLFRH
jgi:hypothetical protein